MHFSKNHFWSFCCFVSSKNCEDRRQVCVCVSVCILFCFAFLLLKQIIHKLSRVFIYFFINKTCLCFALFFILSSFVCFFSLERRAFFFRLFLLLSLVVKKGFSTFRMFPCAPPLPAARAPNNSGSHVRLRKEFARVRTEQRSIVSSVWGLPNCFYLITQRYFLRQNSTKCVDPLSVVILRVFLSSC